MLFQPVSLLFQLFQNSVGACAECGAVRLQEELVSVSRRIEESWANSEQGYWLLGREPLASLEKHFDISGRSLEANIVVPFLWSQAKKSKTWRNWANGWRPACMLWVSFCWNCRQFCVVNTRQVTNQKGRHADTSFPWELISSSFLGSACPHWESIGSGYVP